MNSYHLASIIITFAVLIGYINHRYLKLQTTIAIMLGALMLSLALLLVNALGFDHFRIHVHQLLSKIDFRNLLLNGMLSFLLFAGALTIKLSDLRKQKWEITILASIGTIASAIIVGFTFYYLLNLLGIQISLLYCLLFGALISPTDPIAVLATFKQIGAPKQLDVTVSGESLFNDGVGIVIFLTLYQLAFNHTPITFSAVSELFLRQSIGGLLYGLALGYIGAKLINNTNDHKIEILITLSIVTGGYAFAQMIHISGPLAMVAAGIFVGNKYYVPERPKHSQEQMHNFWELIDEILNAILFFLIGFELLVLQFNQSYLIAALLAIPLVLIIRLITVAVPMWFFKLKKQYPPFFTTILVWGGLRGGLAVALALSLPTSEHRDLILSMTYAIVAFAIIIQGMTVKPLVTKTKEYEKVTE